MDHRTPESYHAHLVLVAPLPVEAQAMPPKRSILLQKHPEPHRKWPRKNAWPIDTLRTQGVRRWQQSQPRRSREYQRDGTAEPLQPRCFAPRANRSPLEDSKAYDPGRGAPSWVSVDPCGYGFSGGAHSPDPGGHTGAQGVYFGPVV